MRRFFVLLLGLTLFACSPKPSNSNPTASQEEAPSEKQAEGESPEKEEAAPEAGKDEAAAKEEAKDELPPKQAEKEAPSLLKPESLNEKAPDSFKVKFDTTRGEFTIQVTRDWAPLGADRFYNLVKNGYFENIAFFRVISNFMAQFGIHGDPNLNKVWRNAGIQDDPVKESNTRGRITFATAGPNSRTVQLFINFANNARLDNMGFAPFGEVTEGMEVVDSLYSGYGEGAPQGQGPDQGRLQAEGKSYLEADFPRLDILKSASIVD